MAEIGFTAFKELAGKVFDAADAADGEGTEESGFTAYVRELEEAIDEIAAEETDEDALDALAELRVAVVKMAIAGVAAEDVLGLGDITMCNFALEIEEAIDMMAIAVETGEAYGEICEFARKTTEKFTRQLREAVGEKAETRAAADEAVLGAGEVEEDHQAMDGQAFLDDQAQREMYEEAFLDELDYHEMVFAIDEALDESRQEAAGCSSPDPSQTGFLGRYGFVTPQDLLPIEAIDEMAATGAAANGAVLGAGEVEGDDQAMAMDRRALLDDQAQRDMYEEAFLDELDYQEMVFAIDEARDELRQEAAACSADPPRSGFLGRYGFVTVEDLFN